MTQNQIDFCSEITFLNPTFVIYIMKGQMVALPGDWDDLALGGVFFGILLIIAGIITKNILIICVGIIFIILGILFIKKYKKFKKKRKGK